jgi:type IV pilus assembly protein PilE
MVSAVIPGLPAVIKPQTTAETIGGFLQTRRKMSPDRAARGSNIQRGIRHPCDHRAFTLIELMVVVLIIGALLALTLTIIPKVKRAVYGAETQSQLSALAAAINQYYNDYKSYPGPLPNNQLCAGYDSSPITPFSSSASPSTLLVAESTSIPQPHNPYGYFQPNNITGAQNLVLGLLGGLEMVQTTANPTFTFEYNPLDIFAADGVTPAPRGPASLNTSNPRRQQAYISVKPGEISTPASNYGPTQNTPASFADSAQRSPGDQLNGGVTTDAMIPVFLDKYSEPLPILYYRTNVGATAIAGFRSSTPGYSSATIGGSPLSYTDSLGNTSSLLAQYDLSQNLPYTASAIGTLNPTLHAPLHNPNSIHGLIGLGETSNNGNLTDTIDTSVNGTYVPSNSGSNAIAYFADPSVNTTTNTNVHLGVARQKDGYLLISAGADRQYGTHDDQIFPGGQP